MEMAIRSLGALLLIVLMTPAVQAAPPAPMVAALLQHVASDPDTPVLGNRAAKLTVVEFFDYRCPNCRAMAPDLADAIKDPRVRLVAKEWPIFGGVSVFAARVALASQWQGRFAAVHRALFAIGGPVTEGSIREAARRAGLDMARLDHDLAARRGELDAALARNGREAALMGFKGPPGLLIGALVVPGALASADLKSVIEEEAARR